MKTGIFLQARLESSHLPKKILLPLCDVPVIVHCMRSLQLAKADHYVILTNETSASAIKPLTRGTRWEVFVGSDDNVLDRYVQATRKYAVDRVLRATANNPAISYEIARSLVDRIGNSPYVHFQNAPAGIGTELISAGALLYAHVRAKRASDRQNVTPYIVETAPDVKHLALPHQYDLPFCKVALVTQEDYRFLSRLFESKYEGKPLSLDTVTSWCRVDYVNTLQSDGCA